MENIFMTDVDVTRRLSIRYGKGELISIDFKVNPNTGLPVESIRPHWHSVLKRMAQADDAEIKIDYWLKNSHGKHPPLRNYVTTGIDSNPANNDELFAVIIPLHHPRYYLKADDPINPTVLEAESLGFQLDIHNGKAKRQPACCTKVKVYLTNAHLELLG